MAAPDIGIISNNPADGPVIHVLGVAAECQHCHHRQWYHHGWALYWVEARTNPIHDWLSHEAYDLKGWQLLGPGQGWCAKGCRQPDDNIGGLVTMYPVSYADQEAYHAAYKLGGDKAVVEMLPQPAQPRYALP